jgi:hypothetical protein
MDIYPLMVQSKTTRVEELTLTLNGVDYLITQADIDTITKETEAKNRSATDQLYIDLNSNDHSKRRTAMNALDNAMVQHHIDGLTVGQRLVCINNTIVALPEVNDHDFNIWAFKHMHALARGMKFSGSKGNGLLIAIVVDQLKKLFEKGRLRMDNEEQVNCFIDLLDQFPAHSVNGRDFTKYIAPSLESWIGESAPLELKQRMRFNKAIRRLDLEMAEKKLQNERANSALLEKAV